MEMRLPKLSPKRYTASQTGRDIISWCRKRQSGVFDDSLGIATPRAHWRVCAVSRRIGTMKSPKVAAIVVSAALSLSLTPCAGAADARNTPAATASWLDRAVEWIAKTVQPISGLWEEDGSLPAATGGTGGGASLDRCGAIDPWGGPCI
jgi:hypothetical protein